MDLSICEDINDISRIFSDEQKFDSLDNNNQLLLLINEWNSSGIPSSYINICGTDDVLNEIVLDNDDDSLIHNKDSNENDKGDNHNKNNLTKNNTNSNKYNDDILDDFNNLIEETYKTLSSDSLSRLS